MMMSGLLYRKILARPVLNKEKLIFGVLKPSKTSSSMNPKVFVKLKKI